MALPPDRYSLCNGLSSIPLWYVYPKHRRKKTRAAARAALVAVLLLGLAVRQVIGPGPVIGAQLERLVVRLAGCVRCLLCLV